MKKDSSYFFVLRTLFCIGWTALLLYGYIDHQNELTELRLAIPKAYEQLQALQEENTTLRYDVERFESPLHVMELLRKPEFAHLKYRPVNEVIELILPSDDEREQL